MDRSQGWVMGTEKSFLIVYPPGAYGHFIGWLISWCQDKSQIDRPWDDRQTSHKAKLTYFISFSEMMSAPLVTGAVANFQNSSQSKVAELIACALDKYDKIIYVQPTQDSMIWYMNRRFSKTSHNDWFDDHKVYIQESMNMWGDDLAAWQRREFLSMWFAHWISQELDVGDMDDIPNVLLVDMTELRDNMIGLCHRLMSFLGLQNIRDMSEVLDLWNDFLTRQEDMHKDDIIREVIHALITGTDMAMPELSLVDQAEIQRILRDDHGIEIRCFNLNDWPKTTHELRQRTYLKDNKK